MHQLTATIRRLLEAGKTSEKVMTVTLDLSKTGTAPKATAEFLKKEVAARLQAEFPDEATVLQDRLAKELKGVFPKTESFFAVMSPTTWETIELAIPLANSMNVGPAPFVAPLVEALANHPPALLVTTDGRRGTVTEYHAGVPGDAIILEEAADPRDVQNSAGARLSQPKAGSGIAGTRHAGAGRDRFQNHRTEHSRDLMRRVVEVVVKLRRQNPGSRVYFFGARRLHSTFRQHLPTGIECVCEGTPGKDPRTVLVQVRQDVERRCREQADWEIADFLQLREQGEHVAIGPEEVRRSLAKGTLVRVFVDATTLIAQEMMEICVTNPRLAITFVRRPCRWLVDIGGLAGIEAQKPAKKRSAKAVEVR